MRIRCKEAEKIQRFFPYCNQYQVNGNKIKFTYLYKPTKDTLYADNEALKGWRMVILELIHD